MFRRFLVLLILPCPPQTSGYSCWTLWDTQHLWRPCTACWCCCPRPKPSLCCICLDCVSRAHLLRTEQPQPIREKQYHGRPDHLPCYPYACDERMGGETPFAGPPPVSWVFFVAPVVPKDSLRRIPSRELYLAGKIKAPQWPLTEAEDREWNPFSLFCKGWLYCFA